MLAHIGIDLHPLDHLDAEASSRGQRLGNAFRSVVIVVDMHAEATSEKIALGWYLDGRVSTVVGTHTHVQTADERILPGGTAFISDVGMTGPRDSIIGMAREEVLQRFLTLLPARFDVAKGPAQLNAVLLDIDGETGRARSVERINRVEA